jgi:hypothetical protein
MGDETMGEWNFVQQWLSRGALCALAVSIYLVAGSVTQAFASEAVLSETHVFDPRLSLTGNCQESELDPLPDPGCPEGTHPPKAFSRPDAVAIDPHGDMLVASFGQKAGGSLGRVDVFDPNGFFISEVAVPGPENLAVDSKGYLYVSEDAGKVVRCDPVVYAPAAGEIEYSSCAKVVDEPGEFSFFIGLAVNPANDHVFTYGGEHAYISEYGSAEEGNKYIETFKEGVNGTVIPTGLAIDAKHGRIYVNDVEGFNSLVRVVELAPPHKFIETFDGSSTPSEKFIGNRLSIAADEETGNVFVFDGNGAEIVYELSQTGEYLATIDHELQGHYVEGAQIEVDNGKESPNGALNPFGRYLFVPAYPGSPGHSFAFGPEGVCAPEAGGTSFSGVTEDEAELHATINPCSLETSYVFEYTTQHSFEEEGFAGASVAGEGQIPAGPSPVNVDAVAEGLAPGTSYRFRVVATNELGEDEAEGEFATYPAAEPPPVCPNEGVRTGLSALLPDCRAYELVTPANTNARTPIGVGLLGTYFPTLEASPLGDKVTFGIEGGILPGGEGTGSQAGDPYLATRGKSGWSSVYTGPPSAESPNLLPGSNSPDQGYSFWSANGEGSAAIEGKVTNYVRYPDGHSALVGRGDLGSDAQAEGKLITDSGGHIVLASFKQLTEDAPPSGTQTVYDRTADEVTHLISLLPGNITPSAGKGAVYLGASPDGTGIAFNIGNTLYLRYNNEETYEVGEKVTFAGVARGGKRIFYLEGGNLFAFEVEGEENPIAFSASGDVTAINVSTDGNTAYFVSPSVLTGEENPNGAIAQPGEDNLYRSREGALSFVGTVTERDVKGELGAKQQIDGLGLWTKALIEGPALDPSRTTSDGGVLLFESRAPLAGYDPMGHAEVYRYDSVHDELECLSCIPTGEPASGTASLQSVSQAQGAQEPFSAFALVENLRSDGHRAFFQSTEPLVLSDTDGLQDVYEWEAQGVGSCERPGGCLYLISSGHSERIDYLYAVSGSGDNVFFRSSDLLLPADSDETPSIYDARVEGGFPEAVRKECQGEGCRPTLTPPPSLPTPGILPSGESGNWVPPCPKGKHKVVRQGKARCVKKHHRHHHRKAGSKKGAGK